MFSEDGSLSVTADCTVRRARYRVDVAGALTMTREAIGDAACEPPSVAAPIVAWLAAAQTLQLSARGPSRGDGGRLASDCRDPPRDSGNP